MVTLAVLLLGFFVFEFVGYWFHRALHHPWMGILHTLHMRHHSLYPAHDYVSKDYRGAGAGHTVYAFFGLGVVGAAVILYLVPLWLSLPLLLEMAVIGVANNYVHDTTHIDGYWLERFQIFQKWRLHHYYHHLEPKKNFGIVTFFGDRISGTFRR